MTLTRSEVIGAIQSLLRASDRQLAEFVRLVGTRRHCCAESSCPPATSTSWRRATQLSINWPGSPTTPVASASPRPRWLDTPFGGQYIADYEVHGVQVEFSTVELSGAPDASFVAECAGDTPWRYFDTIDVEGYAVRLVASELRLLRFHSGQRRSLASDCRVPVRARL